MVKKLLIEILNLCVLLKHRQSQAEEIVPIMCQNTKKLLNLCSVAALLWKLNVVIFEEKKPCRRDLNLCHTRCSQAS